MKYLAKIITAASTGFTEESRDNASNDAWQILKQLFGPGPEIKKKPLRAKDFLR